MSGSAGTVEYKPSFHDTHVVALLLQLPISAASPLMLENQELQNSRVVGSANQTGDPPATVLKRVDSKKTYIICESEKR